MQRKTEIKVARLNNNFVELQTLVKEKFANKEFFNFWQDLTKQREYMKLQIKNTETNLGNMKKQLDIILEQIDKLDHDAQECKARS